MRIRRDALKFGRRRAGVVALGIGNRQFSRHVGRQFALGKIVAETLEHADRPIPLLEVDELRGGVVFGGGADL